MSQEDIRRLFAELGEHEKERISRMSLHELEMYRLHLIQVLESLNKLLRELK